MSTYSKASLVLIPSGTKTSKIYSQKPINGDGDFSFYRSTMATRVNESGLIEKETQNLVLHSSNQLDLAYNIANSLQSKTAVNNPLTGNNDAFKIVKVSGSSDPYLGQEIYTSVNGCYTGSMYLWTDSGQPTNCEIFLYNAGISEVYTKSITLTTTPTRYEFFVNFNSTGGEIRFRLDLSTSTDAYLYTYGWQLERGLAARDYIETTTSAVYGGITDNVPRIDYTNASCPSLLLEPTRTNIVLSSEYPYSSGINGIPFPRGGANVTYNYGISPEGLQNSTLVTGTNGNVGIQVSFSNSDINVDWSYSFYIKGIAGETVHLRYEITPYVLKSQEFITFTGDWQRIESTISYDETVHVTKQWYITFLQQSTATQFEIYGLQAESNASFPTSYIPTYGTSVSRNADKPVDTPIANFAEKNFTLFVDSKGENTQSAGTSTFGYQYGGGTIFRYSSCIGYSTTSGSQYYCGDFTSPHKWALSFDYDSSLLKIFVNGVLVRTATDINPNRYGISYVKLNATGTTSLAIYNQVIIFKEALTDQEAINLTTI